MNVASEDFSSKVNVTSELNLIPEIKVTPEIDVTSEIKVTPEIDVTSEITCETDAVPGKNLVDDVSKVDAVSEIHVMSNTDIVSNKIDGPSIDKSFDIEAPPRRLRRKLPVDQRKRRPVEVLNPTVSKQKFETDDTDDTDTESVADESRNDDILTSDGNIFENIQHEENSRESSSLVDEKSKIQQAPATEESFAKTIAETKETGSNTVEIEKSKLERASAMLGAWKARMAEASIERRSEIKRKKAKLRSTVERKMESIERTLEDHVERIWEENVEKHSWLQPIDTWIVDHRKPSSSYAVTYCQGDANEVEPDVVPEPVCDFKPTMTADEEPKIESGSMENRRATTIDESKIERRVIEHLRKLRNRAGSPKSDRIESANLTAQLKKQEAIASHEETGEENPNVLIDPGVLEIKEVKRHDLLDKLKDNVKEKMEDIHRVVIKRISFFLMGKIYNEL
ncbi:multiple c2 and transmembrane domain-containing protein 2 [Lasius niger]|uniref:Multiple c2 and transmembrane domain-containing protein 2 n=1 Tax=Lasius niger TaxID=67767 RepID=A0A0J7KEK6_LASNI|nr:multiple c2 and transmembrane domain-containing protein 2 [Lasius niger]